MDAATLYRRPLPSSSVPFASEQGKQLFREALEAGTVEAFFPLVEQFHTQADPAFCGLASLVMALNALGIDPGRVWRGPWRWFSEELLDCCAPLSRVQSTGLSLDELACLARCNGAQVELTRADQSGEREFRDRVHALARGAEQILVASYSRAVLGQTGTGHFSPIGGYHAERDMLLLLDVARFKYPPHWVATSALFEAMQPVDPATSRARGWLTLRKPAAASAIAELLVCTDGAAIRGALEQLLALHDGLCRAEPPTSVEALGELSGRALAESGVLEHVRFRSARSAQEQASLDELAQALGALPLAARVGSLGELGPAVLVCWLTAPDCLFDTLPPALKTELSELCGTNGLPARLAMEIELARSQLQILIDGFAEARARSEQAAAQAEPEAMS